MGLFGFLKKNKTSNSIISKTKPVNIQPVFTNSYNSDDLIKSKYGNIPRFYVINGRKYDIDKEEDINDLPLIKVILDIDGRKYGLDTILHELYRQCPDKEFSYVAYRKCEEFRSKGIIHKSEWELAIDANYERNRAKERQRKEQCNQFKIEDMYQFSYIPFAWEYVNELNHTNGKAWFMLNWNNRHAAMHYISQISEIISDSCQYIDENQNVFIDLSLIDFDYPVPMYPNSVCNTRVECYPYTPSGKLSKYPAILQFSTKPDKSGCRIVGEIKIMRDGNIGSSVVSIYGIVFKIGLHGISLVLKRADITTETGRKNLFLFSEQFE